MSNRMVLSMDDLLVKKKNRRTLKKRTRNKGIKKTRKKTRKKTFVFVTPS